MIIFLREKKTLCCIIIYQSQIYVNVVACNVKHSWWCKQDLMKCDKHFLLSYCCFIWASGYTSTTWQFFTGHRPFCLRPTYNGSNFLWHGCIHFTSPVILAFESHGSARVAMWAGTKDGFTGEGESRLTPVVFIFTWNCLRQWRRFQLRFVVRKSPE